MSDPMSANEIVYWAILGIVGGAATVAIGVAGWLLLSHLALVREFDQFKGQVAATYATTPDVKEVVSDAIAPMVRDIEAQAKAIERQSRLLAKIAGRMHIPASDDDD